MPFVFAIVVRIVADTMITDRFALSHKNDRFFKVDGFASILRSLLLFATIKQHGFLLTKELAAAFMHHLDATFLFLRVF